MDFSLPDDESRAEKPCRIFCGSRFLHPSDLQASCILNLWLMLRGW